MTISRRRLLGMMGAGGAAALAHYSRPWRESPIADLLPYYAYGARHNIVRRRGRRAMLSSHLYPRGTFVRDAFYGPLALNDVALSVDCYHWFESTQLPNGQIMTAVGFSEEDQTWLTPMDDDSSLLFVIWSAWLRRRGRVVSRPVVEQAFQHIQSHVNAEGDYISPAGPFRYWADTVSPEAPERITHNQGLYALALRAMHYLGWGEVTAERMQAARERYAVCYQPDLGTLPFGRDTWWAPKQDISTVFPEFLARWAFGWRALPDEVVLDTIGRCVETAAVYKDGTIAGIKVICDTDGAFLPADRFFASVLNRPGDYQNGGHWPMYALTALALAHRIAPSRRTQSMAETLVSRELEPDPVSKEIIRLGPGEEGTWEPRRSGYTWNALIGPAVTWAGIV